MMPKGFENLTIEDQAKVRVAVRSMRVSEEDRLAILEKELWGDWSQEEDEVAIITGMEGKEGEEKEEKQPEGVGGNEKQEATTRLQRNVEDASLDPKVTQDSASKVTGYS